MKGRYTLKIAIVDDLIEERNEIMNQITAYFMKHMEQYQITPEFDEFSSGEMFLTHFKPKYYDLVILDIYMDQLSGMETAEKLIVLDKQCKIIFFTSSTDHMLEGYGVHALGYILKPLNQHQKALYKVLDYFVDLLELDRNGVMVKTNSGEQFVLYKNIVSIESSVRHLYLYMPTETIKVQGTYLELAPTLLKDGRFLETYRNLLVNMDYIEKPLEKDFRLKTGELVPISRRKKSEVLEKYTQYFIRGRGF